MIKFITLSIKNFMSYGNVPTVVNFTTPGTVLIVGENLDRTGNGTGNNGVGKTTIISALTYALYDKPLGEFESIDNVINNINKKNLEVIVTFEKDGIDYRVRRVRKEKSGQHGNYVQLFINDEDKTPDSVSNANKEVERILGLPYELFVRIVAFSALHKSFLDLPARHATLPNQTDFIEELFNLKILSEDAVALKKEISTTEQSLETITTRIEVLKKDHDRHNKMLEAAERRVTTWVDQHDTDLLRITKNLASLEKINVDQQRELFDSIDELQTNVTMLKAQYRSIDTELTSKKSEKRGLEKQNTSSESQIKAHKATIKRIEQEIQQLEKNLCPTCQQQFQNTRLEIDKRVQDKGRAEEQIKALELDIQKNTNKIDAMEADLSNLESKHTSASAECVSAEKEVATLKKLLQVTSKKDLEEINNKVISLRQELLTVENASNPFLEPLNELKQIELDPIDMSEANELTKLLEHQKFLLKLLTKKDSFVRKTLLSRSIPLLNERLSEYLIEMELPHTVRFSQEMTADVSQFGRSLDFGGLSNGQRARVNLSLSLAFRDVLEMMHSKINVCMLDEVLDFGLDTVGVACAAKMLKRKAQKEQLSMFIISHRDEVYGSFDRKLTVQMSKGFSFIKTEEPA